MIQRFGDRLRTAELVAHGGSIVAVVLTLLMVGSAQATEANPVTAWLIAHGGLTTWALATPLLVAGGFALVRWAARRGHRREAAVAGWTLAGGLALDALGNLVALSLVGPPESARWALLGQTALVLVLVATVLVVRPDPRPLVGAVRSPAGRRALGAVAFAVLIMAGLPAGLFGAGGPAETIDTASAASGTIIDSFEDGDLTSDPSWDSDGNGKVLSGSPPDGSKFARIDSSGIGDSKTSLSNSNPSNVSVYIRWQNSTYDRYGQVRLQQSGGPYPTVNAAMNASGYFVVNDGGVESMTSTGYKPNTGEWYRVYIYDLNYTSNTYSIKLLDSGDNVVVEETNLGTDPDGGDVDYLAMSAGDGGKVVDFDKWEINNGLDLGTDSTSSDNTQTFVLDDQSGRFPAGESKLYAWKADSDGSITGGIQSSESFDYQNESTLTLVDDETYLLEVRNEYTGDVYEVFPYTYQKELSGDYTIYIDDSLGNETTNETANQKPSVWIEKDPLLPATGETVTLTADAFDPDGNITSYDWEFEDGTTATGQTVERSWQTTGLRDVTVTVTDDDNGTASYTSSIYVGNGSANLAPRVWFDYDPLLPATGESVTFAADASDSDGEIVSRTWYIDGEQVGSGAEMQATFQERGSYTVTLAVEDDQGATAEYDALVTVFSEETVAGQDATALGTCTVPGSGDMGLLIEYYDPSYSTSTLNYEVTWNGTTYSGTKQFDTQKGYYMGCLAHEDIDQDDDGVPDVGDGENESAPPEWVVNGSYGNGTDFSYNGSGFDANQAGAINGTGWLAGGGPIVGENTGAGAPTWLTALPALAVIGYFGYRRFRGRESSTGASSRGRGGGRGGA